MYEPVFYSNQHSKDIRKNYKKATQIEKNILVTTEFCIIVLSKEVRCLALFSLNLSKRKYGGFL